MIGIKNLIILKEKLGKKPLIYGAIHPHKLVKFLALMGGEWECRVCGPVPKINPQPAARLRDIKKNGFIIASKRRSCPKCKKKTTHDILIMIDLQVPVKTELRKPISKELNLPPPKGGGFFFH